MSELAERAIVAGVYRTGSQEFTSASSAVSADESLLELTALAESAGAIVVDRVLQGRPQLESATLLGSGKVTELKQLVETEKIDVVLINQEITGSQQRNLEHALNCRVVDRTQLILDIFARRARTREGHLQVELAQLSYLLPRLVGRGSSMSRLGGGIGTRGPGETRLETDRRRIRLRIKRLRAEIENVRKTRGIQRRKRQSVPLQTVALVGYTNAGKSTLFNRLTGAGVTADARLFATLDPTVRQLVLSARRKVLLSDTVGFIRELPTTLVDAFRATLEEVTEAALLLHVVDASSDSAGANCQHVHQVLSSIGAEKTPQILVLNKVDQLPGGLDQHGIERLMQQAGAQSAAAISAKTGAGCPELLAAVDTALPVEATRILRFLIPLSDAAAVHWLHQEATVLSERYDTGGCEIEAEVSETLANRLEAYIVPSLA